MPIDSIIETNVVDFLQHPFHLKIELYGIGGVTALLFILALLLTACASESPSTLVVSTIAAASPTQTATFEPIPTSTATFTVTPVPTQTPTATSSPTSAATATSTLVPTPVPTFTPTTSPTFTSQAEESQFLTKAIVLIIIDGARWSETFGHPDQEFIPHLAQDLAPLGATNTAFYNDGLTLSRQPALLKMRLYLRMDHSSSRC